MLFQFIEIADEPESACFANLVPESLRGQLERESLQPDRRMLKVDGSRQAQPLPRQKLADSAVLDRS